MVGQKRVVAIARRGEGRWEEIRRKWGSSGTIQGSLPALRSATEVWFPALHHFRLSNRTLRVNVHSLPRTSTSMVRSVKLLDCTHAELRNNYYVRRSTP